MRALWRRIRSWWTALWDRCWSVNSSPHAPSAGTPTPDLPAADRVCLHVLCDEWIKSFGLFKSNNMKFPYRIDSFKKSVKVDSVPVDWRDSWNFQLFGNQKNFLQNKVVISWLRSSNTLALNIFAICQFEHVIIVFEIPSCVWRLSINWFTFYKTILPNFSNFQN